MRPVHPDECIQEEEEENAENDEQQVLSNNKNDEGKEDDEEQSSSSASERKERNGAGIESRAHHHSNHDVNDLKDDLDSIGSDEDDNDQDQKKKRRIKSDGNMDEDSPDTNDADPEGLEDSDQARKEGRAKDQSFDPLSRSSEFVSCSPTNYDLMKEQIQVKCESTQYFSLSRSRLFSFILFLLSHSFPPFFLFFLSAKFVSKRSESHSYCFSFSLGLFSPRVQLFPSPQVLFSLSLSFCYLSSYFTFTASVNTILVCSKGAERE